MSSRPGGHLRCALRLAILAALTATAVAPALSPLSASAGTRAPKLPPGLARKVTLVAQGLPQGLLEQTKVSRASVQQGINFAGWSADAFSGPAAAASLQALAATGATWASVVVEQYQSSANSTSIFPTSSTVSDASITSVVQLAHDLHLNVTLKPMVDTLSGAYRGTIGTGFSASQWSSWFTSYRAYLVHYARLAQRLGVQQLVIGTELEQASSHAAQWLALIKAVRHLYGGSLTYAANFGSEVEGITWWNALDSIGVDAYYSLDPNRADFGWPTYLAQLSALSERFNNKPIVFTEVGYMSTAGAASQPWNYGLSGPVSLTDQADAYQATFSAVASQPWFAGMYWWTWSPQIPNGPNDGGYSPQNKPAEQVLAQWYGGAAT
jgi:Glycoside Hydrolase Family 113